MAGKTDSWSLKRAACLKDESEKRWNNNRYWTSFGFQNGASFNLWKQSKSQ